MSDISDTPENDSPVANTDPAEACDGTVIPDGKDVGADRFYGRRKGNRLSDRKQSLMETLLPTISIDLSTVGPNSLDASALFPHQPKNIWLEIGFGKGEHLAWQANANPDVGLIGCEPYLNGVAGLLTQIDNAETDNIRVYSDDARHILTALPEASLDKVFLIHPDPWPKARHAKRRFLNQSNLDHISRVLKDGGEFRCGTDHPIYREWVALQMSVRDDFIWTAERPSDWTTRADDWPETRYERKSLEGPATYFHYIRQPR